MSGEIIRMGDHTSHGGTVLEGSPTSICLGKPIALVGHNTQCPKCRGIYPIIEGVLTATLLGKSVAIAGMKTACGATLIPSQFTAIVTVGAGFSASDLNSTLHGEGHHDDNEIEMEHYYSLTDGEGKPAQQYRYDIHINDIPHATGATYQDGNTASITDETDSRLVTWLHQDSLSHHEQS